MSYWQTMVAGAFDSRERHRPDDRQTLHAAALDLRQRGLTDRDVAAALRLTEQAVHQLLGEMAAMDGTSSRTIREIR